MARLPERFDANQVDPATPFEVIPAGDYDAMIVDSQMKETRDRQGGFIELKIQIVGGPHDGKTLYDRLNIHNHNEKAVEIAYRTLSAICRAVGVLNVDDTEELHNRMLNVKVAVRSFTKDDGSQGQSNEVKGYTPPKGQQSVAPARPNFGASRPPATTTAAPAAPTAPAAAASGSVPPWKRSA